MNLEIEVTIQIKFLMRSWGIKIEVETKHSSCSQTQRNTTPQASWLRKNLIASGPDCAFSRPTGCSGRHFS